MHFVSGRNVLLGVALLGAHIDQTLGDGDGRLRFLHRYGEFRALHDGRQQRGIDAKVRRLPVVDLKEDRSELLPDPVHAGARVLPDDQAAVGRHVDALRAVLEPGVAIGPRGHHRPDGNRFIQPCVARGVSREVDLDQAGALHHAPLALLRLRGAGLADDGGAHERRRD